MMMASYIQLLFSVSCFLSSSLSCWEANFLLRKGQPKPAVFGALLANAKEDTTPSTCAPIGKERRSSSPWREGGLLIQHYTWKKGVVDRSRHP